MPAYLGNKQLFRNRLSTRPLREIYWGNKRVMGFSDPNYTADEIVTKAINGVEAPPTVTGTGSVINVSTTKYASGYAYSKFYCDYLEFNMMYSGNCYFYDSAGNVVVSIECTDSFSYATAKWTLTCKVSLLGTSVLDDSTSSTKMDSEKLKIKIYFDFSTSQWVFERAGVQKRSAVTEWQPTYFCVMPKWWFIIGMYDSNYFDGYVQITKMNKAVGYPQAMS